MYVIDSNQYVIELVAYVSVLMAYFFESIIYMLLAFDSIAFFSHWIFEGCPVHYQRASVFSCAFENSKQHLAIARAIKITLRLFDYFFYIGQINFIRVIIL